MVLSSDRGVTVLSCGDEVHRSCDTGCLDQFFGCDCKYHPERGVHLRPSRPAVHECPRSGAGHDAFPRDRTRAVHRDLCQRRICPAGVGPLPEGAEAAAAGLHPSVHSSSGRVALLGGRLHVLYGHHGPYGLGRRGGQRGCLRGAGSSLLCLQRHRQRGRHHGGKCPWGG